MQTIAILEPDEVRRAELQCTMEAVCRDWQLVFCGSAMQMLETLGHDVDVMIAPDATDLGSTTDLFLQARNNHASTLRIVLLDSSRQSSSDQLSSLVNRTLSRQSSPESLIGSVSAALQLRAVMCNKRLRNLVEKLPNVPTLPEKYQEIQTALQNDTATMQSIGRIIETDPALTARILQLANSAAFGLPHPVSTAGEALSRLGINTVAGMVLSHGVFTQFDQRTIRSTGIRDVFWHSSVMGQLARRVMADYTDNVRRIDQAMTAGILSDIGTLVLAAGMPDAMAICRRIVEKDGRADWDVESDLIGFTHMQVGAMLLSMWDLPDSIIEAVAYHHNPSQCPETQFTPLSAVHVGNAILKRQDETIVPNLDWPYIERINASDHVVTWNKLPEQMNLTGSEPVVA